MEPTSDRETILRRARRIELRSRRLVARVLAGTTRSVFRGSGIEFESVREYAYGDDVRAIDWNVTARAGRLFVKQFITTRERDVILAIDRSASMRFGSRERRKDEVAAELAAILALVAMRGRERIGLVEFGTIAPSEIAPSRSRGTTERLVSRLLEEAPSSRRTDWFRLVERVDRAVRRRCLMFVISDFLEPPMESELARLNYRHEVIAVRVVDPREEELEGDGVVACVDPETGVRFALDAGSRAEREAFRVAASARRERFRELLLRSGVEGFDLSTADDRFHSLFDFLIERNRGRA